MSASEADQPLFSDPMASPAAEPAAPAPAPAQVRRSQMTLALGSGVVDPSSVVVLAEPAPGAGAATTISDGGGPVIANVDVRLVFWGSSWATSPSPAVAGIVGAISRMVSGPYMSALAQYRGIRRGRVTGQDFVTSSDPPNSFQDSDVSSMLQSLINNGAPEPDQDSQLLYIVIMPVGISPRNTGFTGEHTSAVYVDTDDGTRLNVHFAWVTNNGTLDNITEIASHEIAEACSDPEGSAFQIVPRNPSSWNEIGDSGCGCQSVDTRLDGILVQKYWSQLDGACEAPSSDIIGFRAKSILGDTSDTGPALAAHDGRLFLAWKGAGNDNLNVMFSDGNGQNFGGKHISGETSDTGPALASGDSGLFIAWKGSGNDNLNVARVGLFADTAGNFGIEGLQNKVILGDTSDTRPALAFHAGRCFIAWKGSGNDNLNVMVGDANGQNFGGKHISTETSDSAPALVSHGNGLFIAWKGSGNDNLNVARVSLFADTRGNLGIEGLTNKVILGDTSDTGPALASDDDLLFLGWKGSGNDNLNVMFSANFGASFGEKHISGETSDSGPALAGRQGQLFTAWKGSGNENLNGAFVQRYGSI